MGNGLSLRDCKWIQLELHGDLTETDHLPGLSVFQRMNFDRLKEASEVTWTKELRDWRDFFKAQLLKLSRNGIPKKKICREGRCWSKQTINEV